eukprot:TRINITY_DN13434_c0_g1_i1.p1 TRINITY_DN13434_c0_g1~~TRINITY_DN13434_c0_g1_i1.p1  ORF type:complete len:1191 (+),score=221.78 TRINITY_DN13434_c0_g1_i1:82-3573(+)
MSDGLEWIILGVGAGVAVAVLAGIALQRLCCPGCTRVSIFPEDEEGPPARLPSLPAPAVLPASGELPLGSEVTVVPPPGCSCYVRCGPESRAHTMPFQLWRPGLPLALTTRGRWVVQAFSSANGSEDSPITTVMLEATTVQPPLGPVRFSHASGAHPAGFELALWHDTADAVLYTIGEPGRTADPYQCPPAEVYSCPIPIPPPGMRGPVEVRAVAAGSPAPATVQVFSVVGDRQLPCPGLCFVDTTGGPLGPGQVEGEGPLARPPRACAAFTCPVPGAAVHYGVRMPGDSEQLLCRIFTAPVVLPAGGCVVEAIAVKHGWQDSDRVRWVLASAPSTTIPSPTTTPPTLACPVFDPPPGRYPAPLTVRVSVGPPARHVRVTTDDTDPRQAAAQNAAAEVTLFDGPEERQVVRAVAEGPGGRMSAENRGEYRQITGPVPWPRPPRIFPRERDHVVHTDAPFCVRLQADAGLTIDVLIAFLAADHHGQRRDPELVRGKSSGDRVPVCQLGVIVVTATTGGAAEEAGPAEMGDSILSGLVEPGFERTRRSVARREYSLRPPCPQITRDTPRPERPVTVRFACPTPAWWQGPRWRVLVTTDGSPPRIGAGTARLLPAEGPSLRLPGGRPTLVRAVTVHFHRAEDCPAADREHAATDLGDLSAAVVLSDIAENYTDSPGPSPRPVEVLQPTPPPTFSPPGELHRGVLTVRIHSRLPGSVMRWKPSWEADDLPAGGGRVYSPDTPPVFTSADMGPHGSVTLHAVAHALGMAPSAVTAKTYRVLPLPPPVSSREPALRAAVAGALLVLAISPRPPKKPRRRPPPVPRLSCHAAELSVVILARAAGDEVRYTLDGSDPSGGRRLPRGAAVAIPSEGITDLRACAVRGGSCSETVRRVFVEGLVSSAHAAPDLGRAPPQRGGLGRQPEPPAMIAHARAVVIVAVCDDPGGVVRYSLDGAAPAPDSQRFPSAGLCVPVSRARRGVVLRVASFGPGGETAGEAQHQFDFREGGVPQGVDGPEAPPPQRGAAPPAAPPPEHGHARQSPWSSALVCGDGSSSTSASVKIRSSADDEDLDGGSRRQHSAQGSPPRAPPQPAVDGGAALASDRLAAESAAADALARPANRSRGDRFAEGLRAARRASEARAAAAIRADREARRDASGGGNGCQQPPPAP